MKNPVSPIIMPNFMFPFFRKIELNVMPEIQVKRIIMLTIIEVLTNISKTSPFIVSDGMLIRKSKNIAKEAMKKAKKLASNASGIYGYAKIM